MSGEMNTSLGNGLTNLILMSYVFDKCKITMKMVAEGDDAVISCDELPDMTIFNKLGFKVEFITAKSLGELSFCGMQFDEEESQSIRECFKAITNMSIVDKQYLRAKPQTIMKLIQIKALSYLFENPQCPMVSAYARAILRSGKLEQRTLLRFLDRMQIDSYAREKYLRGILNLDLINNAKPIGPRTRALYEKRYGISIIAQEVFEADPLSESNKLLFRALAPIEMIANSKWIEPHLVEKYVEEEVVYGYYTKTEDLMDLLVFERGLKRTPTPLKLDKVSSLISYIAAIPANAA